MCIRDSRTDHINGGNTVEQGGLAGAGCSHDSYKFSLLNGKEMCIRDRLSGGVNSETDELFEFLSSQIEGAENISYSIDATYTLSLIHILETVTRSCF